MSQRKLSEKQWAAIAILSQPKRAGLTYDEIAERVGVARSTIFEWKKLDKFNEALKDEIVRNTLDSLPEIMESIPKHIIESGNAALFRTLVQMHGLLTEKIEVESKEGKVDVDEIKARIERMRGEEKSE